MSETTPDPVTGNNDPFRSDDEARDESQPGDDSLGFGIPLLGVPDQDQTVDRDEPGDRV